MRREPSLQHHVTTGKINGHQPIGWAGVMIAFFRGATQIPVILAGLGVWGSLIIAPLVYMGVVAYLLRMRNAKGETRLGVWWRILNERLRPSL